MSFTSDIKKEIISRGIGRGSGGAAEKKAASEKDGEEMAAAYRDTVIPLMTKLRAAVDEMETLTAASHWPFPTYGQMMFRL